MLYWRLLKLDVPTLLTHEPGGTPLSKKLGRWLKWSQGKDISPLAELLLFNASRVQLLDEVIKPALESGKVVVCDRYADSTIAYQSYGRGLDLETVLVINSAATRGLTPDLAVLLDALVEKGLARKREEKQDRFEQEDISFHRKVREGYLKLVEAEPERWLVVDAARSQEEIAEIIWQRVSQLISSQFKETES
jgi:dTMP kinase